MTLADQTPPIRSDTHDNLSRYRRHGKRLLFHYTVAAPFTLDIIALHQDEFVRTPTGLNLSPATVRISNTCFRIHCKLDKYNLLKKLYQVT